MSSKNVIINLNSTSSKTILQRECCKTVQMALLLNFSETKVNTCNCNVHIKFFDPKMMWSNYYEVNRA